MSDILIKVFIILIDESHIINISKGIRNTLYTYLCVLPLVLAIVYLIVINTLPTIYRKYFNKMRLPTSRHSKISESLKALFHHKYFAMNFCVIL